MTDLAWIIFVFAIVAAVAIEVAVTCRRARRQACHLRQRLTP